MDQSVDSSSSERSRQRLSASASDQPRPVDSSTTFYIKTSSILPGVSTQFGVFRKLRRSGLQNTFFVLNTWAIVLFRTFGLLPLLTWMEGFSPLVRRTLLQNRLVIVFFLGYKSQVGWYFIVPFFIVNKCCAAVDRVPRRRRSEFVPVHWCCLPFTILQLGTRWPRSVFGFRFFIGGYRKNSNPSDFHPPGVDVRTSHN